MKTSKPIFLFVVIVVIFIALIYIFCPMALLAPGPEARKISCLNNLKSLALSSKLYCEWNNGYFPDAPIRMYEAELKEHFELLVCPNTGTRPAKNLQDYKGDMHNEYLYFGKGIKYCCRNPEKVIIACDKPENHKRYFNVWFADGHIQGYNAKNIEGIADKNKLLLPGYNFHLDEEKIDKIRVSESYSGTMLEVIWKLNSLIEDSYSDKKIKPMVVIGAHDILGMLVEETLDHGTVRDVLNSLTAETKTAYIIRGLDIILYDPNPKPQLPKETSKKETVPYDPENIDWLAPLKEFTVADYLKEGSNGASYNDMHISQQLTRVDRYLHDNCSEFFQEKQRWPASYKELEEYIEIRMDLSVMGTIKLELLSNGCLRITTEKKDITGALFRKIVLHESGTGFVDIGGIMSLYPTTTPYDSDVALKLIFLEGYESRCLNIIRQEAGEQGVVPEEFSKNKKAKEAWRKGYMAVDNNNIHIEMEKDARE